MVFPLVLPPGGTAADAALRTSGAIQQQALQNAQEQQARERAAYLHATNPYAAQAIQARTYRQLHPNTPLSNALTLWQTYHDMPAHDPRKAYLGNLLMQKQMGSQWVAQNVGAPQGIPQDVSREAPQQMPPQAAMHAMTGMPQEFTAAPSQMVARALSGGMGAPQQIAQQPQEQPPGANLHQTSLGEAMVDPLTAKRGVRGTVVNYPTADGGFVTTSTGTTSDTTKLHQQQIRDMENQIFTPLINNLYTYTAGGTGTTITPSIRITKDISAYKNGDLKSGNRLINYLVARNFSFENSAVRAALARIPGGIEVIKKLEESAIPDTDALGIARNRIPPELWKIANKRIAATLKRVTQLAASMHARRYEQRGVGHRPLSMERRYRTVINPRTGTPMRVPVQ